MHFKNGMFGACLVVCTLLLTVLIGFTGSVERDTVPTTNYQYVTDVSGLFDYTNAPEYTEYNPSTNYTGYTNYFNNGDVSAIFTDANAINPYRYVRAPATTTEVNETLTYNDTFAAYFDSTPSGTSDGTRIYRTAKVTDIPGYNFGTAGTVSVPPTTAADSNLLVNDVPSETRTWPSAIKLSTLLNTWIDRNNLDGYATLEIELTHGDAPVLFYNGSWSHSLVYVGVPTIQVDKYHADINADSYPTKLTVNMASLMVTGERDDTTLFQNVADNIAVLYNYKWNNSGELTQANASITATITATTYPTYGYMDPNKGIDAVDQDGLNWSNGYVNNTVTMKYVVRENSGTNISFYKVNNTEVPPANFLVRNHGYFSITSVRSFDTGQVSSIMVTYKIGNSVEFLRLGAWPAVQITFNGSGDVIFTPTADTNLRTSEPINDSSVTISGLYPAENINNITVIGTANLQVTNTTVFLDTYNAVMYDPSITVSDYFDFEDWRLNFFSFATYGDSLEINGSVLTVDRKTGNVTFTDTFGVERTAKLNNLYVTQENINGIDHTKLTFVGVGSYDLGYTTDETIRFNGLWYFTSAIYEGYETTQTVYNWDLDGSFHANAGQCLVVFLGVIGAGVVVARGFAGVKIQLLDWVIMIFAVFGAVVYFGGLI